MLTLRKRKGGNWYVRGTIRVGDKQTAVKEHSTGLGERPAAQAYKTQLEKRLQEELLFGTQKRAADVTFAEVGTLYITRPEGLRYYDVWRIGELNEVLGDTALNDIKAGWLQFQQQRCQGLSPATVERFRAVLQAALNHYGRAHDLSVPQIPKIKVRNERVRWLTKDTRDTLIAAYARHVQPIVLTLCFQGCRTQEALQLRWEHASLDRGTLYFPRTKNGEPRSVKMHPRAFKAVVQLWEGRGRPSTGHVFLNRLGQPYADTRDYRLPGSNPLRSAHTTACKRAKVDDFRVHDWRHHWASWCVMSGIDLETIKRMGGWKSLRMVERYAAVSTDHMERAIALVD